MTTPMSLVEEGSVVSDAVFDPTGTYRYRLSRTWAVERPIVGFVMLNPSTADAVVDDPTIRRCIGFARRWGYGGIVVVNLFAYRATVPRILRTVPDPVGPENDAHLLRAQSECERLVLAWGVHGKQGGRDRTVLELLDGGGPLDCLGVTREGHPRHPLFLPRDVRPRPYTAVFSSAGRPTRGTSRARTEEG